MNKLTKLGVTALCGSLAAVSSANAGELTVAGGVDMSWISMDNDTTGNPIGIGSNYTLSGSGDMDNGWGVALAITMTNKNIYSSTNVTVTVPALGDFLITTGVSGTGIDRMDDVTPNVWEEAYATGLSTGINTVGGASGGAGIEYTPNMMPDGVTARLSYSPNAAASASNDKGASGGSAGDGAGYDVTIELSDAVTGMSGLTIGAGLSNVASTGVLNNDGDREEQTVYATYAMGGLTVGYQWSEEDLGQSSNEQQYDNDGYGVTFAINDDLSIGYNHYESEQTSATNVTAEASSYQIAYSMGGASVRLARGTADNMDYNTGAIFDNDNTVLSVALAF
jgi:outer membrane protein OmpU